MLLFHVHIIPSEIRRNDSDDKTNRQQKDFETFRVKRILITNRMGGETEQSELISGNKIVNSMR